jgi:hypothetical protein
MSSIKTNRAFTLAGKSGIFLGPETRKHIWSNITSFVASEILDTMTSKQLAAMIVAASKSYHAGRAGQAACCDDCCGVKVLSCRPRWAG